MATKAEQAGSGVAGQGPPPPYRIYDIDATMYDASGNVVAEWRDVQEVWLEPPAIAVRRTRELPGGKKLVYEDRGKLGPDFRISGDDGFGGSWGGRPFPQDGIVFTEGKGSKASFAMTSWTETPGEEHCLRVLDVHEPVPFLTEDELAPGRYYVRTRDHLRSASDEVPDSMKQPT
ncbi:MAG: hypothetical protein ACT4PI_11040 [Actinomycetota bacterium]